MVRSKSNGPVVQRRDQVDAGTTDQRLLDSRGPSDWVHTDPWRVLRIQAEFIEGFGALAELGPAISVFGSARTPADHPAYALGEQVGRNLAESGFAVITGGGPGVMEAVSQVTRASTPATVCTWSAAREVCRRPAPPSSRPSRRRVSTITTAPSAVRM